MFKARFAVLCLAPSTVFAVFTLAVIPIVAEQLRPGDSSFYDVCGRFNLLPLVGPNMCFRLKSLR